MQSGNRSSSSTRPAVLCLSGLDPSGGAGIQADIEALFSAGCHCAPVITALTVQDTHNVLESQACDPALIVRQARAVLEDLPIKAIKLGLAGSVGMLEVIHTLLRDYPNLPVVADPVLKASGGHDFGSTGLIDAYKNLILPLATVITPNSEELDQLATTSDSHDAAAAELLDHGCRHVLLTGTHLNEKEVINRLYTEHAPVKPYSWPRLPGVYHGSGCTLAAAMAGFLAHGVTVPEAAFQAQHYTWHTLEAGYRAGCGQYIPNRAYWSLEQSPG